MAVHPKSAAELLLDARHTRKLSTGCALLDATLDGGINAHGITEIAGAAGVGKTQLVLQLMLQAMLPPSHGGLGGGSVLLHTEVSSTSSTLKRLSQLATAFASRHAALGATAEQCLDHVSMSACGSMASLEESLRELPRYMSQKAVRLLVIDSVGALFRGRADRDQKATGTERANYGGTERVNYGARGDEMGSIAARLKTLSNGCSVAVVVVNQISTKPDDDGSLAAMCSDAELRAYTPYAELGACEPGTCKPHAAAAEYRRASDWGAGGAACDWGVSRGLSLSVPALGLAWTSCLNSRIVLTRRPIHSTLLETFPGTRLETRQLIVLPPLARGDHLVPTGGTHAIGPPSAPPTPFVPREEAPWGEHQQRVEAHDGHKRQRLVEQGEHMGEQRLVDPSRALVSRADPSTEVPSVDLRVREMHVIFSPTCASSSCRYEVRQEGVFGMR